MACRYRGEARLAKLPYHGPRWDAELPPFRRTDRILFLGYVRDYKGLDLLIEALSKSEEMPALVVAGEFWQPVSKFRELAEKHRVAERVEFRPGFVDETDLLALLDQVDLLVLPYKSATATQLPALARTRKTPTIVTPVGELANSVEHMKNGIVASQVTADAIAQAIASAYNSDLLRALSENCSPPDERLEWDLYLKALLEE
jgi:glycosyltransferase involved in cell wall biosynthesis